MKTINLFRWLVIQLVFLIGFSFHSFFTTPLIPLTSRIPYDQSHSFGNSPRHKLFATSIIESNIEARKNSFYLFNHFKRKKELFTTLEPNKVKFYSCGPTVYDFAHLGNFRAFLTYDLLKRWLLYCGYDVEHVCNLTDIDDKIIQKMITTSEKLNQTVEPYIQAFFQDLHRLNILPANHYPRATQYIPQMQQMIETLIEKGHAYNSQGSIYFNLTSYPHLDELYPISSNETISSQQSMETFLVTSQGKNFSLFDKRDTRDFALWKAQNSIDRQVNVGWFSSFGIGRPGWHIECSAMCHHLLGDSIDVHGGGIDLLFPHHTNEIIQSESFTNKSYSKHWIHNGFVTIENTKMSKSLSNFKTLRDIIKTSSDAKAFRYLIISSQYRSSLNFHSENFQSSRNTVNRILKAFTRLNDKLFSSNQSNPTTSATLPHELTLLLNSWVQEFEIALCDDLNMPRALVSFFKFLQFVEYLLNLPLISSVSSASSTIAISFTTLQSQEYDSKLSSQEYRYLLLTLKDMFLQFDRILGLLTQDSNQISTLSLVPSPIVQIPEDIQQLAKQRAICKQQKAFQQADQLRQTILSSGYIILDQKDGQYEIIPKETIK